MDRLAPIFLSCFGLRPIGKVKAEKQDSPYQRRPRGPSSRQNHPNVSVSEQFKSPQYFMGLPPSPKIKAAETMGTPPALLESPATAKIARWLEDLSGNSVAIAIGNRKRRVSFAPELPRRSTIEPKGAYTFRERSSSSPAKAPTTYSKFEKCSPIQSAMPKREVPTQDKPILKLSIPDAEPADDVKIFKLSEASSSSSTMVDSSICTPIYTPAHANKLPMPGAHHLQKLCGKTFLASELPSSVGGSTRPELVTEEASARSETSYSSAQVSCKTIDATSENRKLLFFEGNSSAKEMNSKEDDWVEIEL
ncbi:MAG: hypothetical protein Q9167_006919 [Letrouitia subvulpina]